MLGKSDFRSGPFGYSYVDFMNIEEKKDEIPDKYLSCSRNELHIRYPDQRGRYSITWKKNEYTPNNCPKIKEIIFRLKPSNTYPKGATYIYGINFITKNKKIREKAKAKKQKPPAYITIKRHWGEWYEIDYHPFTNESRNISIASKKYINDIANTFLFVQDKNHSIAPIFSGKFSFLSGISCLRQSLKSR